MCHLVCQLGSAWRVLQDQVSRVLAERGLSWPEYDSLVRHALANDTASLLGFMGAEAKRMRKPPLPVRTAQSKLAIKQAALCNVWGTWQQTTKDDWLEWSRRISVELLRQSPSPALRACAPVAQMHAPLARRLFQVSFIAAWSELSASSRESIVQSIELAFLSPSTPTEILQELLALAEYMERHDSALPISVRTLGEVATSCNAFAKALHYHELDYYIHESTQGSSRLVEALVSVHNSLKQPEAALGVLLRSSGAGCR